MRGAKDRVRGAANLMELVQRILKGDVRAAARLMTMIENGDAEAKAALKLLYAHTGSAHIIGITGPPG